MATGHLDELQKAVIVSKSKLVPSVFIKTHRLNKSQVIDFIREMVVTDRFHCIQKWQDFGPHRTHLSLFATQKWVWWKWLEWFPTIIGKGAPLILHFVPGHFGIISAHFWHTLAENWRDQWIELTPAHYLKHGRATLLSKFVYNLICWVLRNETHFDIICKQNTCPVYSMGTMPLPMTC